MYAPEDQDIISGAIHVHRRSNNNNEFAVSSIFFFTHPIFISAISEGHFNASRMNTSRCTQLFVRVGREVRCI